MKQVTWVKLWRTEGLIGFIKLNPKTFKRASKNNMHSCVIYHSWEGWGMDKLRPRVNRLSLVRANFSWGLISLAASLLLWCCGGIFRCSCVVMWCIFRCSCSSVDTSRLCICNSSSFNSILVDYIKNNSLLLRCNVVYVDVYVVSVIETPNRRYCIQ